jgi:hypothetical protein
MPQNNDNSSFHPYGNQEDEDSTKIQSLETQEDEQVFNFEQTDSDPRLTRFGKAKEYARQLVTRLNNGPFILNLIEMVVCFIVYLIGFHLGSIRKTSISLLYLVLAVISFVSVCFNATTPKHLLLIPMIVSTVLNFMMFCYSVVSVILFYTSGTMQGIVVALAMGCLAYGQSFLLLAKQSHHVFKELRKKEMR